MTDLDKLLVKGISEDFEKLGWDLWDESIHYASGQTDRISRAIFQKYLFELIDYNEALEIAHIKGSSGEIYETGSESCSCPDFTRRGIPCKHMYYLAMHLAKKQNNPCEDNQLCYLPADVSAFDGFKSPSGGYVNHAKYKVIGLNPNTGRKNKRVYDTFSEFHAIRNAIKEGLTEPFEISPLPFSPPAEFQHSYAQLLGIKIPEDACFEDAEALIERVKNNEIDPVEPEILHILNECEVFVSLFDGISSLSKKIDALPYDKKVSVKQRLHYENKKELRKTSQPVYKNSSFEDNSQKFTNSIKEDFTIASDSSKKTYETEKRDRNLVLKIVAFYAMVFLAICLVYHFTENNSQNTSSIEKTTVFSEEKIDLIEKELSELLTSENICGFSLSIYESKATSTGLVINISINKLQCFPDFIKATTPHLSDVLKKHNVPDYDIDFKYINFTDEYLYSWDTSDLTTGWLTIKEETTKCKKATITDIENEFKIILR